MTTFVVRRSATLPSGVTYATGFPGGGSAFWTDPLVYSGELPVANGGTGSVDAASARAALGVAAATHTHAIADTTGLQAALDAKAALTHTHAIADTTGLQAALDAKSVDTRVVNAQTGASYTLVLADKSALVVRDNASANTTTIPTNATVAFPVGSQIDLLQNGAGQAAIVAASGVTIRSSGGKLKLTGQYSAASLLKRATDEWWFFGDITT